MTSPAPADPHRPPAFRAYLELVRLPNLFTAMADVAMGFLFVQTVAGPRDVQALGLLLGTSALLYAAGVVLNDLFDVEVDSRRRPERPLPSGRVSPAAARRLGWGLLLLGMATPWSVVWLVGHFGPGVVAGLLALCIVAYDAYLKRTPVGPAVMGGCRMLNVLLGMSVAADPISGEALPWGAEHWLVAGGVGTYVAGVTWFARTESQQSSRLQLGLAMGVMLAGVVCLIAFPQAAAGLSPDLVRRYRILMVILGGLIGWPCLRAVIEPVPARVQAAVKQGILSLVILDAAVCYVVCGRFWALMILLLLLPATLLGRWIRLT